MKILVIGSGAREHALLRSFEKEQAHTLYIVGGNPGIWEIAQQAQTLDGLPINETDAEAISQFINAFEVNLAIVGPEAPLAKGVVDVLLEQTTAHVFGPTLEAAKLESSKSYAKDVMNAANVPTAAAIKCTKMSELVEALRSADSSKPYVVKADGLAAGKGVIVTTKKSEAEAHASQVFHSGGFVILEEFLDGPEFSLFFICDGKTAVPLMPAQDFKRIYDDDQGPNTGGMGAYTPLEWLDGLNGQNDIDFCTKNIAEPVLKEMSNRGTPFIGVLFAGLVKTESGIKVIEFNVRFGDPETQVVLEKLQSNLSELLLAAAKGDLAEYIAKNGALKWDNHAYCNIVLASKGYPNSSSKGDLITGINSAVSKGAVVLQAGTAFSPADIGAVMTNGGRVLSVIGSAKDLKTARERAYNYVKMINFAGMQFRTDIGLKAVNQEL
jgi:phosphoribosylamine--glycine ligase